VLESAIVEFCGGKRLEDVLEGAVVEFCGGKRLEDMPESVPLLTPVPGVVLSSTSVDITDVDAASFGPPSPSHI